MLGELPAWSPATHLSTSRDSPGPGGPGYTTSPGCQSLRSSLITAPWAQGISGVASVAGNMEPFPENRAQSVTSPLPREEKWQDPMNNLLEPGSTWTSLPTQPQIYIVFYKKALIKQAHANGVTTFPA